MINLRSVYKVIGSLLFIEAFILFVCFVMAFSYGEDDAMAFIISVIITLFVAFILKYLGRASNNSLSRRDAYLVVTLSWIVFSLFGTLPFTFSGYIPNFTDAYFENMSGFTTTGATILDNVEALPHALLFWRSITQWIGGLGIVFFTVALLPSILTVACMGSYMFFGMNWFDALNYAMTSTATGGFSTHNSSTEFFHSPAIEYMCTLFCFLSGVNFTLLYVSVAKLRIRDLFRNSEFKFYISLISIFSLFIMLELIFRRGYDVEPAFRSGIFQVVSFITTTGLFNDDAGQWPHVTWVILAICMFMGACSGSTSGGVKCIRGVMLLKTIRNEFRQILHPNAVLPLKIDKINIPYQKRGTLLAFVTMYLILCVLASFALMVAHIDSTNSITIILSCLGNVGPTLGLEIGPTMSWSILPNYIKWICALMMLVGRLEIFSVLVILTPEFWKKN